MNYNLTVSAPAYKQEPTAVRLTSEEIQRFNEKIKGDIDQASKELFDDGKRSHLGASVIGDDCSRKLWYSFRWVAENSFSGRMLRLFNRGHRMERVFVDLLKSIGFDVREYSEGTTQFRIVGVEQHFGGSLDGLSLLPQRYIEWMAKLADIGPILLEFKTHNDKQFNELIKKGVVRSHPKHYAQMSSYGYGYSIRYALYCPVNKDKDEVDFQLVELNLDLGRSLVAKAHGIIYADDPPPRISLNPAYFECKFCEHIQLCQYGETKSIPVNCRSCESSMPIEEGQWYCKRFANTIPRDFIPKGCDQHRPIV